MNSEGTERNSPPEDQDLTLAPEDCDHSDNMATPSSELQPPQKVKRVSLSLPPRPEQQPYQRLSLPPRSKASQKRKKNKRGSSPFGLSRQSSAGRPVTSSGEMSQEADAAGVIAGGSLSQPGERGPADVIVGGSGYFQKLAATTHRPWIEDYQPWMTGYKADKYPYPLFDCSSLDNCVVPEAFATDRTSFFLDLFFQKRYFQLGHRPEVQSSPIALLSAWRDFVEAFKSSSSELIKSVKAKRDLHYDSTTDGHKMRVHEMSIEAGLLCCVRKLEPCPMCYKDSRRYLKKLRHVNHNTFPIGLRLAIMKLDDRILTEQLAVREEEEERDAELQDGYYTQPRVTEEDMLRLEQKQINTQVTVRNIRASNVAMRQETRQLSKNNTGLNEKFDTIERDVDYVLTENNKLEKKVAHLDQTNQDILKEFFALRKQVNSMKYYGFDADDDD